MNLCPQRLTMSMMNLIEIAPRRVLKRRALVESPAPLFIGRLRFYKDPHKWFQPTFSN